MPNSTISLSKIYYFCGVFLLVLGWQLLSMVYSSVLVPSPADTLRAIVVLIKTGELGENLLITFQRQICGLSLGIMCGLLSGFLAGCFQRMEWLLQPLISFLLAVPAIIFVTMAMVWFGIGSKMAIFLVALLVFPVMHINTMEGLRSIDRALLEMAQVYSLPLLQKVRQIYLPGMRHGLIAGFSLGMASSIRLTIMAEMLGAREGMGQRVAITRAYLETDQLFAWVLVLLIILISLEYIVIRPLKRSVNRTKQLDGQTTG